DARRTRNLPAPRLAGFPSRKARRSRPGRLLKADRSPSGSYQSQRRWSVAGTSSAKIDTVQSPARKTPPSAKKRRYDAIRPTDLLEAGAFHFVQLATPADAATANADPMTRYRTHRCPLVQIEDAAR